MPVWPLNAIQNEAAGATFSIMSILVVFSSSRPPYSSGTSARKRPRSAHWRSFSTTNPKSLSSIRSIFGKTSFFMNSSVVSAICFCSVVNSSGENISMPAVSANKNSPPFRRLPFIEISLMPVEPVNKVRYGSCMENSLQLPSSACHFSSE